MSTETQQNTVWVYVEGGVVKDRVGVSPATIFLPEYAARFLQAPDGTDIGWKYDGAAFTPPTSEEVNAAKAAQVRAERNRLLSETDFAVLRAYETKTEIALELAAYRQALRDVPQQPGFPTNVVWPQKP